jgi:Icc-related predicted phosphoesterase
VAAVMMGPMSTVRLVCLSDTHERHHELVVPDGDVLVHAGDFTGHGRPAKVEAFGRYLATLPHRHKVVVAGNHDFLFQRDPARARALLGDVHYLEDSGVTVAGLSFWGSPWQPWFHDWAFNLPRGEALAERWRQVPTGVQVLVTHGPPLGVLDRTSRGETVGCEALTAALDRIRPGLHVFGHIHESYGVVQEEERLSVNACTCDLRYRPVNPPVVVDWDGARFRVVTDRA